MPLHLTKIAFGSESAESLRRWLEGHAGEARLTTRYLPKRHEEMAGGSLYWIINHAIVARSPILGFEKTEDGTDVFRSLRLTNIAANQDGDERFFSFRFDARLNFVITPDVIPSMYYLDQNNTIKSEV